MTLRIRSLACSPNGAPGGETFTTGISVTAATRWRTDVWKTIIRNARCANPYNVQLRIYFRAFGSSSSPSSPSSPPPAPVLRAARPAVPQWKPLELRKIDKSPAAEQFVYSAARLRANELERITYSYGLASSSFLLEIPAVDDPSPLRPPVVPPTHLPSRGRGQWCSFRWYPPRVRTCLLYPFTARRPILSRELATFNRFLWVRGTIICLAMAQCRRRLLTKIARASFLAQVQRRDQLIIERDRERKRKRKEARRYRLSLSLAMNFYYTERKIVNFIKIIIIFGVSYISLL